MIMKEFVHLKANCNANISPLERPTFSTVNKNRRRHYDRVFFLRPLRQKACKLTQY